MPRIKWTEEMEQFLINNYEGKDCIELSKMINKKFNTHFTNKHISNKKANLKRRRGIDLTTYINYGKFRKGKSPANKGKKWGDYLSKEQQEKAKLTLFKKGNIPPNRREIGDERIDKDGYIKVKVRDGCLNNNWELKHRYIYGKQHGKLPKGYKVIFADGNRRNFDPDNLIAVSSSQELILNRRKLRFEEQDLTKSGVLIAKVIDKANKKLKGE